MESLNIGPNARKRIDEGIELSDTGTRLGSIELLYKQINAYKEAIRSRPPGKKSDLKNRTDLEMINSLKEKIREIQGLENK